MFVQLKVHFEIIYNIIDEYSISEFGVILPNLLPNNKNNEILKLKYKAPNNANDIKFLGKKTNIFYQGLQVLKLNQIILIIRH